MLISEILDASTRENAKLGSETKLSTFVREDPVREDNNDLTSLRSIQRQLILEHRPLLPSVLRTISLNNMHLTPKFVKERKIHT